MNQDNGFFNLYLILFFLLSWVFSSIIVGYYKVSRFTNRFKVSFLIVKQAIVFSFGFFSYFGIFREGEIVNNQFNTLMTIIFLTAVIKYVFFFSLKLYRLKGNNYRKVVFLGYNKSVKRVIKLFMTKKSLGMRCEGFFSETPYKDSLGTIKESFNYAIKNQIDEIYCSLPELTKEEIKEITKFANANNIILKLIPDFEELYSKNRKVQYYDNSLMVVNVGKLPFQYSENIIIKRIFDVVFSILACLFILSWLYPILWVLIKLESKGPAIFRQKREGLHGEEFTCYKFRSMRLNSDAHTMHASKGDPRVTRIGAFIRKTSLDEIPQFINVLLGDMSVVGPRPHVEALSNEYKEEVEVENYIKRYAMKPGITGLAQVSGYRGEVTEYLDIKNRVRMDVFYIENWSFFLDIKIIFMTVFSVFKGDEKAY